MPPKGPPVDAKNMIAKLLLQKGLSVKSITEQADTDGSGEIELGEWIAFCKTNFKLQLGDKALKAIFDDIDADHSGA
eukprot:245353-Prymnesium_polylepis.1